MLAFASNATQIEMENAKCTQHTCTHHRPHRCSAGAPALPSLPWWCWCSQSRKLCACLFCKLMCVHVCSCVLVCALVCSCVLMVMHTGVCVPDRFYCYCIFCVFVLVSHWCLCVQVLFSMSRIILLGSRVIKLLDDADPDALNQVRSSWGWRHHCCPQVFAISPLHCFFSRSKLSCSSHPIKMSMSHAEQWRMRSYMPYQFQVDNRYCKHVGWFTDLFL